MVKVGILYICTGEYKVFWKDFYKSYEKNFLPNSAKEYYVFTDADYIYGEEKSNVHKIFQESLGWPDNTLMRYNIFLKHKELIAQSDYLFFMNANCLCVSKIEEENFLIPDKLIVVQHPGFYDKTIREYTYDRNPKSTAYIAFDDGEYYVCGGVNGGSTKMFLKLMQDINQNILDDRENGIVALWHDESHLNRYIVNSKNYKLLPADFCYPEDWDIPFTPRILVREKSKWLNVDKIKGNSNFKKDLVYDLKKILRKIGL